MCSENPDTRQGGLEEGNLLREQHLRNGEARVERQRAGVKENSRTQRGLSEAGQGKMSPATCGMEWGEGSYHRRPTGR